MDDDYSQQPMINRQSIEQMEKIHMDFIKHFMEFKKALTETVRLQYLLYIQNQTTNLKYLQCRLDFNEYYQRQENRMAFQKQNRKKKGGEGGDNDFDIGSDEDEEEDDEGEEDYDDEGEDDYDDEDLDDG